MRWEKRGLIYVPSGDLWWARKYASYPTAEVVDDQIVRVYFTSLDENNFGRIGYVELDADNLSRILYETKEPILDIGELGTFDDSGVSAFSVINWAGKKYLYYQGWQRCERVPYLLMTGLAVSPNRRPHFTKLSRVPLLDRTSDEPFVRGAPYVINDHGPLKMWYASCLRWSSSKAGMHYNIVIRCATSEDGTHWKAHDHLCLEPNNGNEYAVGRPWVMRDGQSYKMWYSIRSFDRPYTIGYAESNDGIHWVRKDHETGIDKSEIGWDSEMICFTSVIDVKGRRYLFYNGNRHGSSGFGYAALRD